MGSPVNLVDIYGYIISPIVKKGPDLPPYGGERTMVATIFSPSCTPKYSLGTTWKIILLSNCLVIAVVADL